MDSYAIKVIQKGFHEFQPIIRFNTTEDSKVLVKKALEKDPSTIFYLRSYSIAGIGGAYRINVQYAHEDVDRAKVQAVNSLAECVNAICRSLRDYKKELIVVAREDLPLETVMESFSEKYGTFYPNLTKTVGSLRHSVAGFNVFEFSFTYRIGQVKLAQMEQEVKEEVYRISQLLFLERMPAEAKIYLAHNYLASTVSYLCSRNNNLDTSYTQSAYGALIRKQCVCQGFAEAFKRLMDQAKINCDIVYGQVIGSKSLHAWNIVALGNESNYYHIDVTWDAAAEKPVYQYFCKNDAFFLGKREWNRKHIRECTGSYPVLAVARKYIIQNKQLLLGHGIDNVVLDCSD